MTEPAQTIEPVFVVQFPHPGAEHYPPVGEVVPWNLGNHGRKFMISRGRAVDGVGTVHEGEFAFWGEWEAPSRVIARWLPAGRLPQYLHQPFWHRSPLTTYRQNTDPWVFGDAFRYSNCKQLTYAGNSSALQHLTRGSVVLFGSKLDGAFVLDTVFVVDTAERYEPGEPVATDEAFRVCTLESLVTNGQAADTLTLYRGATLENPVMGMYSFTPALGAHGGAVRFQRPAIELPGIVNPRSAQSPSGAGSPVPPDVATASWRTVRDQVLGAGLELAVWLETPPEAPHPA